MADIEKALVEYDGDNSKPYCDLVYKALKEMREREENKPLTLEELKEMDGEPVWCMELISSVPCQNYAILRVLEMAEHNYLALAGSIFNFEFADYGETWLAYRYKLC